jgi:hypothetical protein
MRAGEDADPNDVDVLLHGGGNDHFRRLVQSRVDDFHAGIAQRTRNDFRPTIVSVQARLCNENFGRH